MNSCHVAGWSHDIFQSSWLVIVSWLTINYQNHYENHYEHHYYNHYNHYSRLSIMVSEPYYYNQIKSLK